MLSDDWYCDPTTSLSQVIGLYRDKKVKYDDLVREINSLDYDDVSKFDELEAKSESFRTKVWVELVATDSWNCGENDEDFYKFSFDKEDIRGESRQAVIAHVPAHPLYPMTNNYTTLASLDYNFDDINREYQALLDSVKWMRDLYRHSLVASNELGKLEVRIQMWCDMTGTDVKKIVGEAGFACD